MRKLCILLAILGVGSFSSLAQNPNNHWQLGVSDLNFSTNPPTVSTVANSGQYGNASVSDDNGNLLFYTDGVKVWNKNHQIMQNSVDLSYYVEAEQPVIIVPYPGANKYYIFSEVSDCMMGNYNCLDFHRYNYAIIDFTTNPLGEFQVLSSSQGGNITYYQYVKPLESFENGISRHGPLTFTKNSTGDGYWIIVNGAVNGSPRIYSFSLTSTGLSQAPMISIVTSSLSTTSKREVYKFSPDNNTLGILESVDAIGNNSKFHILNFNSSTGVFSNQTSINNIASNGSLTANSFEFSTDSQKVYFVGTNLLVKDLSTPTVFARTMSLPALPVVSYNPNLWHIQRDKYENLLVAGNGINHIEKIDNQNSFSGSSLTSNYLSVSMPNNLYTNAITHAKYTFPQLIPSLTPSCTTNLVITANVVSGTDNKQASSTIIASNTISNGASAIYHAGNSVTMQPPFNAKSGSTVHMYIAGCTGTYVARQSGNTKDDQATLETASIIKKETISILPNPNNGIFNIALANVNEGTIQINDLIGFTIFKVDFKNQNQFEINMQEKPKGIYIVRVFSSNQVFTGKIIKN